MIVIAITQARMTSSRLPGKILMEIEGKSLLEIHLGRISKCSKLNDIILATTDLQTDDATEKLGNHLGYKVFRGSENDVLDRFYQTAISIVNKPDYVVRLTADCPLIDSELVDKIIEYTISKDLDYCSNCLDPKYPDGQDVEVFKFESLQKAWEKAELLSEREHVTPYIWKNSSFKFGNLFKSENYADYPEDYSHIRMTVDEDNDFQVINQLIKNLGIDNTWLEYANFLKRDNYTKSLNSNIVRNEGYEKSIMKEMNNRYSQSEKLLERALKTIPLGAQTFSKSKTQFPYGISPYFASRAEGAYLWDVDGNKYIDFINSLASVTLGYSDPDVTNAVRNQLDSGVIFSLSHELETKVAEAIVEMVPCAEMVRFGKNGSDATSGAIRLARAYTKKDYVLVCGYHGWQDWYIGSTTRDSGVPQAVKELTHKFNYNDIKSLEDKFEELKGKVAAVILEPINVVEPQDNFLQKVKDLTHENGAVLIFDETITGFRYANGGAQEYFGVIPDLATFGKGLANGYPVSAVAGKAEIMKLMEEIFFSFTFGGETLSLAASLAVLEKMRREPVVEKLQATGQEIIDRLTTLIEDYKLGYVFGVTGLPVWSFFTFKDTDKNSMWGLKTLFMQEMLANGILTYGTHNVSYAHSREDINALMDSYEKYFVKIKEIENGKNINDYLLCEPLVPLFKVR